MLEVPSAKTGATVVHAARERARPAAPARTAGKPALVPRLLYRRVRRRAYCEDCYPKLMARNQDYADEQRALWSEVHVGDYEPSDDERGRSRCNSKRSVTAPTFAGSGTVPRATARHVLDDVQSFGSMAERGEGDS